MPRKILILGGTGLARDAANALHDAGCAVLTSLAGVTQYPILPKGEIRKGGFGGVDGMVAFLKEAQFDLVVDATHPFAAQISRHAAEACGATHTRLIRLEPPVWKPQKSDRWMEVGSVANAVAALDENVRVAVTVGRKEIGAFFGRYDISGVARMIEPPAVAVPSYWMLELARPPFTLEHELALLGDNQINVVVSKNAGGVRVAKLDAAAQLGLPVIMVQRPEKPKVQTVASVEALMGP
ncbi:cobalt-precorrin-6A reductase [Aestuariivirga litoralis]|uniref:cobalt-precorrin-6A reductase n=1 Tax=Aestuariivirga litoralis TaxID=2650924 RepID=UPI0018C6AFF5|nr:cobalt-precorrin-6A reductase [Aestuariivirga litoralis]MBG1231332.1 cobalt-precorrin-6A reductase [Aestuariivirga litoralis]